MLDRSTDGVASFDREWRYTYVNQEVERALQRSREELLGRVLWEEFPEALATVFHPQLHRVLAEQTLVEFEAYYAPLGLWLEVRAYPSGEGVTAHFRDISLRKRAEMELRASEELNRRILEAVPAGVVHVLADGSIAHANAQAQRLLGLSLHALTDRYVQDFDGETIREDGSPFPSEEYPVSKCLRTGESQPPVTIGVRRPDGDTTWAVFSAVPLRDPETGLADGAVVTFLDISERMMLERQLLHAQKMEAVGRLAGGIAHDFNNLLTVITGHTDFLVRGAGDGTALRHAEKVMAAAERASALTRQLLGFSRSHALDLRIVELDGLVESALAMLGRLIGEDISLVVNLASAPARVKVDPGQIEQVITNLLVNARDAMAEGGRLTIETSLVAPGEPSASSSGNGHRSGRAVMLSVTDTGHGMDAATQARIFEPFFTTKEQGRGTGLGLSTVYAIVKQCGGQIRVSSQIGHGSTFAVELPEYVGPSA